MPRLYSSEWVTLVLAVLWVSMLANWDLVSPFPALYFLPMLALATLGFAILGICWAVADRGRGKSWLRTALPGPLLIVALFLLGGAVVDFGRMAHARSFLEAHRATFDARAGQVPPGGVAVFGYINGMLGSSQVIVHADHEPTPDELNVAQDDLVGCRALDSHYRLCILG